MNDLRGKAALVTGAGTRVGAAIARRLGELGMRVAVHHRSSASGAAEVCRAIIESGGEAQTFAADLTDLDASRDLVDRARAHFGALDLLVPSAAVFEASSIARVTDASVARAMRLNCESPLAMALHAKDVLKGGSIVFITCTSVTRPYRGYLPYVLSKAALHQAMRVLALELAPDVRVNAVAPGTVLPPESLDARALKSIRSSIPLARFGAAIDVADAVAYLASAPFVTGHELVVDGGRLVESAL